MGMFRQIVPRRRVLVRSVRVIVFVGMRGLVAAVDVGVTVFMLVRMFMRVLVRVRMRADARMFVLMLVNVCVHANARANTRGGVRRSWSSFHGVAVTGSLRQ